MSPQNKKVNIKQRQAGVFVLGMHRSGTSCISGMLQASGFESGTVNEWSHDNRKGNRESEAFTHINEEILKASGGSWTAPPASLEPTKAQLASRESILRPLQESYKPWMLKDPRTIFLLPFWLDIAPNTHLLGIFRSPIDVAISLALRNSMSIKNGLQLWQKYNLKLLEHREHHEFPLVYFPDSSENLSNTVTLILEDWYSSEISKNVLIPSLMGNFFSKEMVHNQNFLGDELQDQISIPQLDHKEVNAIIHTWKTLKKSSVNRPKKSNVSNSVQAPLAVSTLLQIDKINLLVKSHNIAEAIRILEQILLTHPERTDFWHFGVNILRRSGEKHELSRWIDNALRNANNDPNLQFQKAKICWELDEYDKAISLAENVCLHAPGWSEPAVLLANWYFHKEDWESSAKKFKTLKNLTKTRQIQSFLRRFAQFYIDTGEGFSETQSVKVPINLDTQEQSVDVKLSEFSGVRNVRFDPIDDSGIISIGDAQLIDKNENVHKLILKPINAFKTINEKHYFTTIDPRFEILSESQDFLSTSKILIKFHIFKSGRDALLELLNETSASRNNLDDTNQNPTTYPKADIEKATKNNSEQKTTPRKPLLPPCLREWNLNDITHQPGTSEETILSGHFDVFKGYSPKFAIKYASSTRIYPLDKSIPKPLEQVPDDSEGLNTTTRFEFCRIVPRNSIIKLGIEHDMRLFWLTSIET